MAQRDFKHFLSRRHLQIDRQLCLRHYRIKIAVTDMPPVLAQMNGNPVSASCLYYADGAHGIGMLAPACVADGCDMVDVDA
jgi:hypothetical protein